MGMAARWKKKKKRIRQSMNGKKLGIVNEQTSKGRTSPTRHLGSSRSFPGRGTINAYSTMMKSLTDCEERE
jgi:hypothetical protein